MQAPAFEFIRILREPAGMNGEYIVGHPGHIRLVAIDQPLEFVGDRCRLSAAMSLAEYFVAAPAAVVRATAGGNQRNRAHAMMFAPGCDILSHIDSLAIGPGLGVDIGQLLTRFRLSDVSLGVAEGNAIHSMERFPGAGS